MSFEEAKQILQMEDGGTSLYDHLSQVRPAVIADVLSSITRAFV